MGEIDTKSIKSVQAALYLFGEKNNHRKYRSTGNEGKHELEEKELDLILKDLSNYKVQLEVKESTYQQALLKLELYQKTVEELCAQLRNCENDRDKYIEECRAAKIQMDELQSKIKVMTDQLSETQKVEEKLFHVVNELKSTQEDLLKAKAELASVKESKFTAMTKVELLETALALENEKTKELIAELNEAIHLSKLAAIEAEKQKTTILVEKETEFQMAAVAAVQAKEQLEDMKKQIDIMPDMAYELAEKTVLINSLQVELKDVKDFHTLSEKAASDAIGGMNLLKSQLEQMERANSDLAKYAQSEETEMKQLQSELHNAKQEICHLNHEVEMLSIEIQKSQSEIYKLRDAECTAQVDIAMLKSELHKARSKIATAEAGEARAQSVRSGLYLAVKQLAIEAQKIKCETRPIYPNVTKSTQDLESLQDELPKAEMRENIGEIDSQITISIKEYEYLTRQAEEIDHIATSTIASEIGFELDTLMEELEAARAEIIKLRSLAEQAISRAELADKAKAAVEDQLRKWREQKQRRREALAALREESAPKAGYCPSSEMRTKSYLPLGKVLNIEF